MNSLLKSRLHSLCHTLTALSAATLALACSSPPEPQAAAPAPPAKEAKKVEPQWVPGPSAQEIKLAVSARNTELRQCYMVGTFKNSQLAGTVNVLFTINTAGKVSRAADAGSDIEDPDVVTCVLGVFGGLEFARGGSTDTEVEYPVVFGRKNG